MKKKNLTPFLFAAKVTSRNPPEPDMVLIVRAKFRLVPGAPLSLPEGLSVLAQGSLTGDVFEDDDTDQTGACLYPSDFADFKPQADVLLRGTCHTPGGDRMTECPVHFGVGGWSKILRVVGHRIWMDGIVGPTMSDHVPFTRMPIDDRHSFGGPEYPQNPVGRGYKTRELPNIEAADDVISSRSDRPVPAGFGPISPHRAERRVKLGKNYGGSYRKKRAPYYADDFDWSFFNAAPPDQRIPYLRGDEELLFQNLHPTAAVLRSRLPALRIRAFAREDGGLMHEVPMNLDTLFVDLDEGAIHLVWRGLCPVKKDDLSDQTVLIAQEPLSDPPLRDAHYQQILEKLDADPLEIEDHLPPELKEEWSALQALGKKGAAPAPAADKASGGNPISTLLKGLLGRAAKAQQAQILRAMESLLKVALPDGKTMAIALGEALGTRRLMAPSSIPLSDSVLPVITNVLSRRAFRALVKCVKDERERAAAKGKPLEGLEEWDKLSSDPKLAAMGLSPTEPKAPDGFSPGIDLSGQDLTDSDLSGRDLSGANLTGAVLAGANLRGTRLVGANLTQAVLFEADLQKADLTNADLTTATLQCVRAEGAIFRGAKVDFASFDSARLEGADFSEAHGEQVVFSRADMTSAIVKKARLHMSYFEETTLASTDFSGASLTRSFVSRCHATGAIFTRATIAGTSFADSDLGQALFTDARGDGSVWTGATLTGADFSYATLKGAHFTEARATETRFFGANLRQARFYQTILDRADFTKANLFDADLHKAHVNAVKFVDANLYDAKLYQTQGADCDFKGANLKRSTLEGDR
jgi:uncharacterized protein YjbI with pentapeptide repeats